MKPVEMTDAELETAGPFRRVVFGEGQPQYEQLPAVILATADTRVVTKWHLTDEERAAVSAGADIMLAACTFGSPPQPVLLGVSDVLYAAGALGSRREGSA